MEILFGVGSVFWVIVVLHDEVPPIKLKAIKLEKIFLWTSE